MLNEDLIDFCSPTLAGIKTASMFTAKSGGSDITEEIDALNSVLTKKGLRLIQLNKNRVGTLVYLYRPSKLKDDLEYPEARSILEEKGYPCGDPNRCLTALIQHLQNDEGFPHEIGLFLGYPPSDVKGFMNDPNGDVLCTGCWKVYGDKNSAEKTFARYKKCTAAYRRARKNGSELESLIVG